MRVFFSLCIFLFFGKHAIKPIRRKKGLYGAIAMYIDIKLRIQLAKKTKCSVEIYALKNTVNLLNTKIHSANKCKSKFCSLT